MECELDEALLNLAVAPDTPLWLLCSYDADALGPTGRAAAEVTHPIIVESGTSSGSVHYVGRTWVEVLSSTALPDSAAVRHESVFTTGIVARLLSYVKLELYVCGLTVDRAMQLATATNGLALGSLRRGATEVTVRIWREPRAVIAEVSDDTRVRGRLLGRGIPVDDLSTSLWYVNQTCDLVQMRATLTRMVRLYSWT